MEDKKVSVIIPIHEYNDDMKEMVMRAVKSVPSEYFLYVICGNPEISSDDLSFMLEEHQLGVVVSPNYGKKVAVVSSSFSSLVNYAFEELKGSDIEWSYILEYDDEFNSLWFDEVKREHTDKPDVSVFMPLTEIVDFESGKFLSYGNEAPWASSFSNEIGYIDNESLQQFFDFYLTGSIFNLRDWTYVGGLKESFKLTFWYEFLLRLTHNDKKAYVIPKLGYKHYVNRPNSLHMNVAKEMDAEESQWWYNLALEEYTYKKDRKKEYNKENN